MTWGREIKLFEIDSQAIFGVQKQRGATEHQKGKRNQEWGIATFTIFKHSRFQNTTFPP